MREIKYRIWDCVKNKYSTSELFSLKPNGKIFYGNADFTNSPFTSEIELYTGLKDKNGKEIYEGDVVKKSDGFEWQGNVIFENGQFIVDIGARWIPVWEDIEVIGNIHEGNQ